MNKPNHHIISNDILAERLPEQIKGQKIVFREAFISGPTYTQGHELDFWIQRQNYFYNEHDWQPIDYFNNVTTEVYKIRQLNEWDILNIWTEFDLTGYSNLWFLCHLIKDKSARQNIYIVTPTVEDFAFGFESMIDEELIHCYNRRKILDNDTLLDMVGCWAAFSCDKTNALLQYADKLKTVLPLIDKVIIGHLSRSTSKDKKNDPIKMLQSLMKEIGSEKYELIFWEFTKRQGFLGFKEREFKQLYKEAMAFN